MLQSGCDSAVEPVLATHFARVRCWKVVQDSYQRLPPIAHGLASVSVIAKGAMRADALATALLVLGPERGVALADRQGVAAHFITRDNNGGLHDHASAAFDRRRAA